MQLIRTFEERVRNLYSGGAIPGLVHLCAGQEAAAVGVCCLLGADDMIASNHRGHGHCLAKGGDVSRLMAEVMGRECGSFAGGIKRKGAETKRASGELSRAPV
jgi:TPP-dependent pyruvate/acetoin dehydrogenase alpha subunit